MDLLGNNKKNQIPPEQKLVFILLIFSIMLCLIVGIIFAIISMKGEKKEYSIAINGEEQLNEDLNILNYNGKVYIPLKQLSSQLGYIYHNGEIEVVSEDINKGYIDNETNIIQFFANSNVIYKTEENALIDSQYYNLDNEVISNNNLLYICIDDLDVSLNLIISYSEKNNQTEIQTPDYFIAQTEDDFSKLDIFIDDEGDNIKALSYGYIVINKDGKSGVITLNGSELIGNKYNSITFFEYTGDFIVTNTDNKYGMITTNSEEKIKLQYDDLEILNYNPLLYKVKRLEKYGIINDDGNVINEIKYDSIGYPENRSKEIDYTLIIPKLNENIPESIVVRENGKYGLIDLETGREILATNVDGIYSASEGQNKYYIVEIKDKKFFLENYFNEVNRLTASM